jgi:hypothetical protein
MNIPEIIKIHHNKHFSKTWQDKVISRVIEKNNYQARGNVKEAKAFMHAVSHLPIRQLEVTKRIEQHVIFTSDMVDSPLGSAITFT